MQSDWVTHVKQYAIKHGISYGDALREASSSYTKTRHRGSKVGRGGATSPPSCDDGNDYSPVSGGRRKREGKRERRSHRTAMHRDFHDMGEYIGGELAKPDAQPGLLASLLKGLSLHVNVD
jgi:hypothetical protein